MSWDQQGSALVGYGDPQVQARIRQTRAVTNDEGHQVVMAARVEAAELIAVGCQLLQDAAAAFELATEALDQAHWHASMLSLRDDAGVPLVGRLGMMWAEGRQLATKVLKCERLSRSHPEFFTQAAPSDRSE